MRPHYHLQDARILIVLSPRCGRQLEAKMRPNGVSDNGKRKGGTRLVSGRQLMNAVLETREPGSVV